jgi:uncharacterized protein
MKGATDGGSFEVGGVTVRPGTWSSVAIPVAPLYNQMMIDVRAHVFRGVRPGPRLWISGAIHGDELCGVVIVRAVARRIDPARLAGTLVAVPAVNVFGALDQSRYLPDRRDLNRCFPGTRRGSLAARLAYLFMQEIVGRCTHGIDLHSAAIHRTNLPQIRANLRDRETRRMARAFGAPVSIHADERDGSLRQAASRRGVPTLLYEGGEALRHDTGVVEAGKRGVLRVMGALGMIDDPPAAGPRGVESYDSTWVRAPRSGYLVLETTLGARVRRRDRIGTLHMRIRDEEPGASDAVIRAPESGVVIGHATNPLVHVGDAVVHIARPGKRAGGGI